MSVRSMDRSPTGLQVKGDVINLSATFSNPDHMPHTTLVIQITIRKEKKLGIPQIVLVVRTEPFRIQV